MALNPFQSVEKNNYHWLLQLNFYLGIGISIVCTTSLFDLLYLRMQFNMVRLQNNNLFTQPTL